MICVPVIDLLRGEVVQAIGGRRSEYRPVRSSLTPHSDLLSVAKALLPFATEPLLYIADLDAITRTGSHAEAILFLLEELAETGCQVMVDFGIRTVADLDRIPHHDRLIPILGTETMESPAVADAARDRFASGCVISIDMRNGELLGNWQAFGIDDSRNVPTLARLTAERANAHSVILLDLARVGERNGPTAGQVCAEVRQQLPASVRLFIGGGIRTSADVQQLQQSGANGVLLATALHDGTYPTVCRE